MTSTTTTKASPQADPPGKNRRAFWWSLALVAFWLVVGGFAGSFTGQLAAEQENENATWLPTDAESTQALELQESIEGGQEVPLVVIVTNPGGGALPSDATTDVSAWMQGIPELELPEGTTVADYLSESVAGPIPSEDGEALLVTVTLDEAKASEPYEDATSPLVKATEAIRDSASDELADLQVNVTGPGGLLADQVEVFGEIDTTLLMATAIVVAIILILVYRSPFLWLLPLVSAGIALGMASGIIYALAVNDIVDVNGQNQAILFVLVFGAGTDYALLLVSRYREELHHHDDRFAAMRAAWRGVVAPIVASGATVAIGLLCLLFSELGANKSTGPVAAIGIVSAVIVMLTFLPALLAVFPRGVFWPRVPRHDDIDDKLTGVWSRVARLVGRRPRTVWITTAVVLLALAALAPTLKADGIALTDGFTKDVDSVVGQEELTEHYPAGSGAPVIIIGNASQIEAMTEVVESTDGVEAVVPFTGEEGTPAPDEPVEPVEPLIVDGLVELQATLSEPADSPAAEQTVKELRTNLSELDGANAKVGGFTAVNYDVQTSSQRDNRVIIPIVLAVILVILMLLLRAITAPLLLIATVVLSYLATLGVCAVVFEYVFDFAGEDSAFPLFTFVFLVALGIDYNIFLMTRVREESVKLGTRPGILKGLTVTGGVITSAGIVLAATFSVLGILPLVFIAEIGFAVAFGVLLDTFVVRSLLVPASSYDIGRPIWWPSQSIRHDEAPAAEQEAASVAYVRS
ncbi:MAG TPA: MMPL family transporter [Actinomycetes bacterium]|nr:MMPL family transporter [Actinomycetes bacterium]